MSSPSRQALPTRAAPVEAAGAQMRGTACSRHRFGPPPGRAASERRDAFHSTNVTVYLTSETLQFPGGGAIISMGKPGMGCSPACRGTTPVDHIVSASRDTGAGLNKGMAASQVPSQAAPSVPDGTQYAVHGLTSRTRQQTVRIKQRCPPLPRFHPPRTPHTSEWKAGSWLFGRLFDHVTRVATHLLLRLPNI